jgi:hypothetical protein
MADLTATELARLRRKIGDNSTPPVFTDGELQDIWAEAGANWNKAVLTCYEELLADSYKLTSYTQNQTQERKDQVFDHLKQMRALWQAKVDADTAKSAIQIVPLRVNRPSKEVP